MHKKFNKRVFITWMFAVVLGIATVWAIDVLTPYQTTNRDAGDRITAPADVVRVLESLLVHVDSSGVADGFVNKGDAVLLGTGLTTVILGSSIGVALESAAAATDYINIDTHGVYVLPVTNANPLIYGQKVYIHRTTGILSEDGEIANDGSDLGVLYGTCLGEDGVSTDVTTNIPILIRGGD